MLTVSVAPSILTGVVTTERILARTSSGPSSSTVAGLATLPTLSYPCSGFPTVCTRTGTERPRCSTSTVVVTRDGRIATSGIGCPAASSAVGTKSAVKSSLRSPISTGSTTCATLSTNRFGPLTVTSETSGTISPMRRVGSSICAGTTSRCMVREAVSSTTSATRGGVMESMRAAAGSSTTTAA